MRILPRLVIALVAGALGCSTVPEPQRACESAVSHLLDCCPGFDAGAVPCVYSADSFQDPDITEPALSEDVSDCIQRESCASLTTTGVCARAQAAQSWVYESEPSEGHQNSQTQPDSCP